MRELGRKMIVAEICQNHNGDLNTLKAMVKEAANCGVDAVKIQTFFAEDLSDTWKHEYDRIKSLELDWNAHRDFVEECHKYAVIPMTSVYSTKYLEQLAGLGFQHIKIGSAQLKDTRLVEAYSSKFYTYCSTGGHYLGSIPSYPGVDGYFHCVSTYPHKLQESNLNRMLAIADRFPDKKFGFSSHMDPTDRHYWDMPIKMALALGADLIEAHFTILDRDKTKDGKVSLLPEQLEDICYFKTLSYEGMIEQRPLIGLMVSPQQDSEKETIKKYTSRWN